MPTSRDVFFFLLAFWACCLYLCGIWLVRNTYPPKKGG